MFSYKTIIKILINTFLGIALVYIWLQFVNIQEVLEILKTVNLPIALLAMIFFAVSIFLRSLRLKIILSDYKLPILRVLALNFLAQLLSFLIPLRVGEITKGIYLSTQNSVPLGKAVIWIFIDRFLDFWVILFLISILILVVPVSIPFNVKAFVFLALSIFSILTILIISKKDLAKKFIQFFQLFLYFPKLKKWYLGFTHSIIEGFTVLERHPLELLCLIAISILATISDALIWYLTLLAFGLNFDIFKTLLGSLLAALTFIIPAAPGYIGSAEASALAIFSGILGLDKNLVSAAAILSHILFAIAILGFGIISLYFLKFDLGLVWEKLSKKE